MGLEQGQFASLHKNLVKQKKIEVNERFKFFIKKKSEKILNNFKNHESEMLKKLIKSSMDRCYWSYSNFLEGNFSFRTSEEYFWTELLIVFERSAYFLTNFG